MVEAENHELHWYALKVFYNKVFAVEEELTADGTECYVPVEETMVERGGQRRKVRRPVINSLMFFRADEEAAVAMDALDAAFGATEGAVGDAHALSFRKLAVFIAKVFQPSLSR